MRWLRPLMLCAVGIALVYPATSFAELPQAYRIAQKRIPASASPDSDVQSASGIYKAVSQAVSSRDPRCLTSAEEAQVELMAEHLDAIDGYIDARDRGWTHSGCLTHKARGDAPKPTDAELDRLKAAYMDLEQKWEGLRNLPPCVPPPEPVIDVTPGPNPGPRPPDTPGPGPGGDGLGPGPPCPARRLRRARACRETDA